MRAGRNVHVLSVLALGTCLIGPASAQPPGAPPIDPRAMSGIPRADAQTEPGTITVRCLLGSFREPAAGVTVTLELRSADGSKLEKRTAVAGADGRASFGDLATYFGGTAVASVEFDGTPVSSQPISPGATVGYRVLLVKGAGEGTAAPADAAAGTTPPSAAPGPGDVPLPGTAFPNPGTPKGTILVGTLDLRAGTPVQGAKVRLVITPPGAEPQTREATSDARGTARFPDLGPFTDASFVVEADLANGTQKSQPFTLAGQETGMAVVLAVTGPRMPERRQIQPPRGMPTLAPGTVRVTVVGPDDAPIAGAPVTVVKQDVTNMNQRFDDVTGDDGVARVAEIPVTSEGLFHVEVQHAGAPWRSSFFQLDDRMGVAVELRVYPVTRDLTRVRSAVQFGVEPMENDLARVAQLFQVHVDGDAAYWPATPLKIAPPAGATGMVALDRADMILRHNEPEPFATVTSPIPPGEVIDLSIAYLLAHDGSAEIQWTSPFPVVDARAVVTSGLKLTRGAKGPPVRPPHGQGEARDDIEVYELGAMPLGQSFDLVVDGLVTRPRLYQRLGLGLGLAVALLCGVAFALRPRASVRERLVRRRDALLKKLDAAAPDERAAIVDALDQIFCQLDALDGARRHADPGAAWSADKPQAPPPAKS